VGKGLLKAKLFGWGVGSRDWKLGSRN